MKKRWIIVLAIIVFIGWNLLINHELNYPVRGQIVDAQTHRPVQGAVVAVNWFRLQLGLPGFGPKRTYYGSSDDVTDAQGSFTIPNYPHASHVMGVYKEGYVVWSSEKAYNPQAATYEEKYKPRIWHRVKAGMVIELVPIKGDNFPAYEHARFVSNLRSLIDSPQFFDATIDERKLESQEHQKLWGKDK